MRKTQKSEKKINGNATNKRVVLKNPFFQKAYDNLVERAEKAKNMSRKEALEWIDRVVVSPNLDR